jgi:hypothetical protein
VAIEQPLNTSLDILLNIDLNGRLTTLYDKRDDFNFAIVNFPFLCSNLPLSHACGMYAQCISQLIRYARVSFKYQNFFKRGHGGQLLIKKLMFQDDYESRLK